MAPIPLLSASRGDLSNAALVAAASVVSDNPPSDRLFTDTDLLSRGGLSAPSKRAKLTPTQWARVEIADLAFRTAWREAVLRTAGRLPVRVVGRGFLLLDPPDNIDAAEDGAYDTARAAFIKARRILRWTRDDALDIEGRLRKSAAINRIAALDGLVKDAADRAAKAVVGPSISPPIPSMGLRARIP